MICKFETNAAYYDNVLCPPEKFSFEWDPETEIPLNLQWLHGADLWWLHPQQGKIVGPVPTTGQPASVYYDIDLRMTTKGYEETSYSLKGKLTINALIPSGATFAAIYEGSGTTWMTAKGTLTYDGES